MNTILLILSIFCLSISLCLNIFISIQVFKAKLSINITGDNSRIIQNITFSLINKLSREEKKEILDMIFENTRVIDGGDL